MITQFLKSNILNIFLFVILFIAVLLLFSVKDWSLNQSEPKKELEKVVTIEAMDGLTEDMDFSKSFCESHRGSSNILEKSCNDLSNHNCNETDCCVLINNKCSAGGINGPTYKNNEQDSYYYKNKCYGKC